MDESYAEDDCPACGAEPSQWHLGASPEGYLMEREKLARKDEREKIAAGLERLAAWRPEPEDERCPVALGETVALRDVIKRIREGSL